MIIYGVAVLAGCFIAGLIAGDVLGLLLGIKANVGGVGFAILLLILVTDRLKKDLKFNPLSQQGVAFWSAMYIPIVVAMAAPQNVLAAIGAGPMALMAGVLAVVASFALVPVLSRIGTKDLEIHAIEEAK